MNTEAIFVLLMCYFLKIKVGWFHIVFIMSILQEILFAFTIGLLHPTST